MNDGDDDDDDSLVEMESDAPDHLLSAIITNTFDI